MLRFLSLRRSVLCVVGLGILSAVVRGESQPIPEIISAYSQAWHETDPVKRGELLQRVWSDRGVYKDPSAMVSGVDALSAHIADFQRQFPAAKFTITSEVDQYGSTFRFDWLLDFGNGAPRMDGMDVGEVASDGKIAAITGFFSLPRRIARTANESVVAAYMDGLFRKFDPAALGRVVADGAVYQQAAGLPYGGRYVGLPQWMGMYQKSASYTQVQVQDQPAYFSNEDGSEVIAQFSGVFTSKASGRMLTMQVAEWFKVQGGKIVAITPHYHDTKAFVDFLSEK